MVHYRRWSAELSEAGAGMEATAGTIGGCVLTTAYGGTEVASRAQTGNPCEMHGTAAGLDPPPTPPHHPTTPPPHADKLLAKNNISKQKTSILERNR